MRPLKRVTNSTGNPRHELSQFRAPEKERTRKIKEEDASSRSHEIFNNRINLEMMEMISRKEKCYLQIECCECNSRLYCRGVRLER